MHIEITLLLSLFVFLLACLCVGVGALFGRSAIRGSCGGVMSGDTQGECQVCGRPTDSCVDKGYNA